MPPDVVLTRLAVAEQVTKTQISKKKKLWAENCERLTAKLQRKMTGQERKERRGIEKQKKNI